MDEPSNAGELPARTSMKWSQVAAMLLALVAVGFAGYRIGNARSLSDRELEEQLLREASEAQLSSSGSPKGPQSEPGSGETGASSSGAKPTSAGSQSPSVRLIAEDVQMSEEDLLAECKFITQELRLRTQDAPESLHVAAVFAAQTRQSTEAMELWKRCMKLRPEEELYLVNFATIAMERGDTQLALEELERGVSKGYTTADFIEHLCLARLKAGKTTEAIELATKTLEKHPDATSMRAILGKAQLDAGKSEDAASNLAKAREQGDDSVSVLYSLGMALKQSGKVQEAQQIMALYADRVKDSAIDTKDRFSAHSGREMRSTTLTVISEAAAVYTRGGQWLDAERLWLRALALDTKNVGACRALAQVYYQSKKLPDERVVRERLVQLEPDNFPSYVDLAKVHAQLGDMQSARAVLKMAMTLHPEAIQAFATLAELNLTAGAFADARWYAEQAVMRAPSPEGFDLLAKVCRELKDTAAANIAAAEAQRLRSGKP